MDWGHDSRTSSSLLNKLRLRPFDQAAWEEFVERYGRRIYRWCRHWNLQPADADDVTQEVLAKLAQKMRSFAYDASGSFRAWLKTVVHHTWSDFLQGRRLHDLGSGDSRVLGLLHSVEAGTDLAARLTEAFDQELLEEAIARVRLRVEPQTWDAFRMMAFEGRTGAEVAGRLQMRVSNVFVAAARVRKRLHAEIQRLEQPSKAG
jgi:RNA polymerase sigma-70 factor (ECF subfamily)